MTRLDKLLELFECRSEQEWGTAVFDIAHDNGFDKVLFSVIKNKNTNIEETFLKSNFPAAWHQIYDRDKLHEIDPVVAHCLNTTLPIIWGESISKHPAERKFYETAGSFGLRSGISYPIHGSMGEFGILNFAKDDIDLADYDVRHQSMLALIRDYVYESSNKFARVSKREVAVNAPTSLTPRELECVKWVMVGKSSWEISQILKCSEATINFHIVNLKKKFKVRTRQQAVVKAIKELLIIPE